MRLPEQGARVLVGAVVVGRYTRPGEPLDQAQLALQLKDGQSLITSIQNLAEVATIAPLVLEQQKPAAARKPRAKPKVKVKPRAPKRPKEPEDG